MARLARALLLAAVTFCLVAPSGPYGRRSSRRRRPTTFSGVAAPNASCSGAISLRRSAVVRLRAPSRPVRGSSSPRGQPSAAPLRATALPLGGQGLAGAPLPVEEHNLVGWGGEQHAGVPRHVVFFPHVDPVP